MEPRKSWMEYKLRKKILIQQRHTQKLAPIPIKTPNPHVTESNNIPTNMLPMESSNPTTANTEYSNKTKT